MQRQLVIPDDVTFSTTPVAGDLSDPLSPFESIPFESKTKSAVYTMILTESLTLLEVKVVGLNIKDIILKYRQSMAFLHVSINWYICCFILIKTTNKIGIN